MSLGHFILEICSNVWSFLSDRAHKEYLYLFKKGARTSVGDADRGNAYVNEIVEHFITEEAHAYNPCIIEDKTYTWLRIPLIVDVEHLETFIEGLISLHNEWSCKLTEKYGRLYVTANLGAGPLHFTVCAWGKLFYIEQLITITASLNHCKVNADFSLNTQFGRNGRLHRLCIEEFTDFKICIAITGFRYLSWFLSKLFTLMTIFSHAIIRNLVEFELEHYVRKLLPVCQFPIEGKNANSFSVDRSTLAQVKEKSFKCSNTNICGKSSFNNVSTSNVVSRKAVELSPVESGKKIIANANINNIADCIEEVDNKVEIQLKEKQTEESKISSELEKEAWYTNIPLLKGNEVSRSHESETSNKSDDNIRKDFAFSEDANIDEMEALSMLDLAARCASVKHETEKMKSKEAYYLPSKHEKRFFKSFLKPIEEYKVDETSKFSDQLDEPVLPNENILKNKISLNSFFNEHKNFIALSYNKNEDQKLEVTRPSFDSNSSAERNQSESDSKITLEKGNMNVSLSSKSSNIAFDPKTEVIERGESLNSPVVYALQADKKDPSIDRVKNVESILKGTSDLEDTQESKSYDSKKHRSHSCISKSYVPHQNNCSTMIEFLDKKSKISNVKKDWSRSKRKQTTIRSTQSNIHHTDRNVEMAIINNCKSLRRKNETDNKVKSTCTSIKQLNVIGDEICRYFENPWLVTIPESTFFFEDNESVAVSHLESANKQQESEFAKQPCLLKNPIVKRIGKDVDRTIDVDYILNKTETIFPKQNKNRHPATLNSFVKHAAVSSDSCTISQVVKNFFEQNPNDSRLLRQNIPLTISDENEQSFSCSSNVDFSGALKDKLLDLIPDTGKESHNVFEVEMFNVDPLYSCNPIEITKDQVKQSCETVDQVYKTFDASQSTSSNPNCDKRIEVNSKISNNENLDPSYPLNETFKLSTFKQVALNEDTKAELDETHKTASHRIVFESLKANEKANEYDNKLNFGLVNVDGQEKNSFESVTVSEEAYDRLHADILQLLEEDSQDVSFEREDSVLDTTDRCSFPRTDLEESGMSYTDVTEEFQMRTDHIKYKESLLDHCCVGTLDVFNEIEDKELEYISEQTKQLEVMFKDFSRHHDACETNTFTECPLPYQESTWRNFYQRLCKHEDTDETEFILRKNKESLVKEVRGESYGCISDKSVQDGSPFEECELVNVGGLLCGDITVSVKHSVTKDNTPLLKVQDISYDWDSFNQSVEGKKCPWKECKIVDGEGRVSWKRAMQIWVVGPNSI